jgi:integrase
MEALASNTIKQVDLSVSVLMKPLSKDVFISSLETTLEAIYPTDQRFAPSDQPVKPLRIRFNDSASAIRLLGEFLSRKAVSDPIAQFDENTMEDFETFLLKEKIIGSNKYCAKRCSQIRVLINSLPSDILQRPLLNKQEVKKLRRFDHLSPKSKEVLQEFIEDGRRVKGANPMTLTPRLLTDKVRRGATSNLLLFMRTIDRTDILSTTENDAETFLKDYAGREKRDTALHKLADMNSIFRNFVARGHMKNNPLSAYTEKPCKTNKDYVDASEMEKLQDISSVDQQDMWDVRNRMLVFCLSYDFALRIGETVRLKMSDITINDYVEIKLRSEVQKGQSKKECTLRSY